MFLTFSIWFELELIIRNCPEPFRTFHRPSSGIFASVAIVSFLNRFLGAFFYNIAKIT